MVTGAALADPTRAERAWAVLATVLDPEVPALSVRDLGIVDENKACPCQTLK